MIPITDITKDILTKRGITDEKDIEEYLSLKPQKTYDPFLMKGMEEATELILKTVSEGKKICIYGDYDCDGVSSVFLLTTVLSMITDKENLMHYIPSRFQEGYGLKQDTIDVILDRGADLLITVDCGITSITEVEYAKSRGMEVIVTDHHNVGEKVPDCIVLDPKQEDCSYPFSELCGCGVAYKLAQALQKKTGFEKEVLYRLLDIVGIATIGDVVPLVDENRTIAKYGLYEIRSGRRKSIRKLIIKMQRKYDTLNSYGVSFGIVPHINAAGRMDSAQTALSLIESTEDGDIERYGDILIEYNRDRRDVQDRAYERCLEKVEEECADSLFPVVRDDDAHEGIVGIVAGKLSDKLGRPVIVLTEKDGTLKGSGRSVNEINMYDIVATQRDLLSRFGGHAAACGLALKSMEDVELLRNGLEGEMKKLLDEDPHALDTMFRYDMEIEADDITLKLADELELMEPFGNSNERPAFMVRNVIPKEVTYLGDERQHIRFNIYGSEKIITCIMFHKADEYGGLLDGETPVDLLGNVSVNEFRGSRSVQFVIEAVTESR